MLAERLQKQLNFIMEIDRLKQIYRVNILTDKSRRETSAEHSWHLAVMALLLAEYIDVPNIDLLRVLKMVLIHDLVEIYAGDTYCYDEQALLDKDCREQQAAARLFAMLPDDQKQEFYSLWQEFEQETSPEARFAAALDRLQPLLMHYRTQGQCWQEHGITSGQVRRRNGLTGEISNTLAQVIEEIISTSVNKGYLAK